ncbi:MAG: universal stress protein [Betaproteobacteria bacterium HGW-Betaproteobacteria-22]|nr:MAG: universal stress protein [Betaproteobacteria bacterium HGW-Betaproteobacteria-22]
MTNLSRILVATDLSAPARHAVDRALQVAAAHQAKCAVIHALQLDAIDKLKEWIGEDVSGVKSKLEDEANACLQQLVAQAEQHYHIKPEAALVHGSHLAAITDYAKQLDAQLLVIGARGQGFLRHHVLGSTASRLIRKSVRYPVLVVKQSPHQPYKKVLIPIDLSSASANAIKFAVQLAPDAEIILMHAFEVPFEGKITYAGVDDNILKQYRIATRDKVFAQIRATADAAGLDVGDYTPLVIHGDPSQSVIDQEQEFDVDLIIMGKHGQNVMEELLLGSVTKHVLAESQCDVLVVDGGQVPDAI